MTKIVFETLDTIEQSYALLNLIPDTHAWLKDKAGMFISGNTCFYERFGFTSMQQLVGLTDYDLAPDDMAKRYCTDDQRVLDGAVVIDRLELIVDDGGRVEWFLTSKWPVHNNAGELIGSFGMSHHLNRTESLSVPYQELSAPINYIQKHFSGRISMEKLASACNLSLSALERRFKKHLKKTPRQYITEVRLEHGRGLLNETNKPIGTIALETGFADHSHFSRAYQKYFGCSPSSVRQIT